uniref:HdeD family acid-resistance protein n=1 Tax=Muribaculaceae bacterium Z82 TaxID=2304548 RepID=A0A7C9JE70_9BACT
MAKKNDKTNPLSAKAFFQKVRSSTLLQAVLLIALGLLLLLMPQTATLTCVYVMGAYCVVMGAFTLFQYARLGDARSLAGNVLIVGIGYLVAALVVFVFPQPIASVFSFLLGILMVIGGLVNIVRSVEMRAYPGSGWIPMLVVAALVTVGGVVVVINPFGTTVALVMVLGALLVAKGASDLAMEIMFSHALKEAPQA